MVVQELHGVLTAVRIHTDFVNQSAVRCVEVGMGGCSGGRNDRLGSPQAILVISIRAGVSGIFLVRACQLSAVPCKVPPTCAVVVAGGIAHAVIVAGIATEAAHTVLPCAVRIGQGIAVVRGQITYGIIIISIGSAVDNFLGHLAQIIIFVTPVSGNGIRNGQDIAPGIVGIGIGQGCETRSRAGTGVGHLADTGGSRIWLLVVYPFYICSFLHPMKICKQTSSLLIVCRIIRPRAGWNPLNISNDVFLFAVFAEFFFI